MKKTIFILVSLITLMAISCNTATNEEVIIGKDSTQVYHDLDSLMHIYISDSLSFSNSMVKKEFVKDIKAYTQQYAGKEFTIINELTFKCIGVAGNYGDKKAIVCLEYENENYIENFNGEYGHFLPKEERQFKIEIQLAALVPTEEAKHIIEGENYKVQGTIPKELKNDFWFSEPYIVTDFDNNIETISLGAITINDVKIEKVQCPEAK